MDNIPRRIRLDLMTPEERAIWDAIQLIEAMGADVKLTNAVIKLSEAKDLVSDFIDSADSTPQDPPSQPPGGNG